MRKQNTLRTRRSRTRRPSTRRPSTRRPSTRRSSTRRSSTRRSSTRRSRHYYKYGGGYTDWLRVPDWLDNSKPKTDLVVKKLHFKGLKMLVDLIDGSSEQELTQLINPSNKDKLTNCIKSLVSKDNDSSDTSLPKATADADKQISSDATTRTTQNTNPATHEIHVEPARM